jgi:septal ring factor EnvC (AmiA/AmiB activator)
VSWAFLGYASPWMVVGGIALWWLRDRRKDRAASDVAEQTVADDVTVSNVGSAEARLVFAQRAFDAERLSYERRIAEGEAERAQLRTDVGHRDEVIARLRAQAEEMAQRLAEMTRQMRAMRAEIDELTAETRGQ